MVLTTTQQKIAPKTEKTEVSSTSNTSRNCRRKIAFHPTMGYAIQPPLPAKVQRRNARERNRVKQVNCGFEMLRAHIPSAAKQKKMSKVDTLRHAVEYIQSLQCMLNEKNTGTVLPPLNSEVNNFVPPSYPLTPQTPTSINFPHPPSAPSTTGNESGYDTASSFYSNHSGMMTPPVHIPQAYPNTQNSSCNSPISNAENYLSPTQHQEYTNLQHYQQPQDYYGTPHQDDDELLDVIAKWQEN